MPEGIVTLANLLQSKNVLFSILVTPSGIRISSKLWQEEKASFPIDVTLGGITTLVRFVWSANALGSIETTGYPSSVSGITSTPVVSRLLLVV